MWLLKKNLEFNSFRRCTHNISLLIIFSTLWCLQNLEFTALNHFWTLLEKLLCCLEWILIVIILKWSSLYSLHNAVYVLDIVSISNMNANRLYSHLLHPRQFDLCCDHQIYQVHYCLQIFAIPVPSAWKALPAHVCTVGIFSLSRYQPKHHLL